MKQSNQVNRQIILVSRPNGTPEASNFKIEENPIPIPQKGQLLLRTVFLSLDPYMRGRMSDAESYAEPVKLGDVMVGASVCRVEDSLHSDYQKGDFVVAFGGWQDYSLSDGTGLIRLNKDMKHPSYALGVMGMPGLTAYMGLLDIGKPQKGDTVVVAAATGAVGSLVGQIAKIKGCKVVGVAGGEEKCKYALETLGLDACIDHKSPTFEKDLGAACSKGIDVYFESVGGKVFDAVMPLLNTSARIPVCGLISQYNATKLPSGPDRLSLLMGLILRKRIKMQGFIVFEDYGHRYGEFSEQMGSWLAEGKLNYREDVVDGLENAVDAFKGLLVGKNFGKLLVQVGGIISV
jgi:NADPH-dependent curcumin reductase CurA